MAVGLQSFNGASAAPGTACWHVAYRKVIRRDGALVKRITSMLPANDKVSGDQSLNRRQPERTSSTSDQPVLSSAPLFSCAELPALKNIRLIQSAGEGEERVKLFEYRRSPAQEPYSG